MTDRLFTTVVTVITAIIGVAIIALLVSSKSQTPAVLKASGDAFSSILNAAFAGGTTGFGVGPIRFQVPTTTIRLGSNEPAYY